MSTGVVFRVLRRFFGRTPFFGTRGGNGEKRAHTVRGVGDDRLAAELLKLLPVLRAQLAEAVRASEEGVLSAARALEEMTALVRQSLSQLDEALSTQQANRRRREEEFQGVFRRLEAEFDRLKTRAGTAEEELRDRIRGLEQEDRGETLFAVLRDLEAVSSRTRVVTINASIEAARLGDKGAGFGVVVGELHRLTGQAERAVQSVQEFGQYLLDEVRTSATYMENQAAELKAAAFGLEEGWREARKLMALQREWQQTAARDAAQVAAALQTADRHLDEGVTAFQFQDAVAQQIGHVREVLRRVEDLLSGGESTKTPDIVGELEAMYTMERERAAHRRVRGPAGGTETAVRRADDNIEFF